MSVRKIDVLKRSLPLPDLLVRLGLFSSPPGPGSHRCPLHGEVKGAAFSISRMAEAWLWNCYGACGGGGDEITLIEKHLGVPRWGAIRHYAALCGDTGESPRHSVNPKAREVLFPRDLRLGAKSELEALAALRKVDFWAVAAMQQAGVLRFGTVCEQACWLVTDAAGLCAEARRLDGKWFEASGKLGARKAHTLPGSVKNWPVGLLLDGIWSGYFKKVLWLEGSGDLAAGYHFAIHSADWLPVAMLGASVKQLHPDAVEWLKEKQVRLVPHADAAGRSSAERWGAALDALGCAVDTFELEGLRRADGTPVKDLNDCTDLHPDDQNEMNALLK